jgi:hypothetical protein
VAVLTLGTIVAGHFTDVFGPRWIWAAAAVAAGLAGIVGYVLSSAVSSESALPEVEPQPEPQPLHAAAPEPTRRAV